MFGIFARSFMTATRTEDRTGWPTRRDLPKFSWLEEDLPFRHSVAGRRGYDD